MNDLPEVVQCSGKLFADDMKLYSRVSSIGEAALLQSGIQALSRWSNTWLMPFNQSKCKVLHLGHTNQGFPYTMGDIPLDNSSVEKDLGVHIDTELKFREHASSAAAEATQVLAVIRVPLLSSIRSHCPPFSRHSFVHILSSVT